MRKSDFPANAKYNWGHLPANVTQGLAGLGVKGSGAFIAVTIPTSSTKYQSVDGGLVATASPAQAKTTYGAFKSDFGRGTTLRLPAYGDEQVALFNPSVGKALLLVRKNRVVWELEVMNGGLLTLPKAKLISELQKYAAKQKARIGAG